MIKDGLGALMGGKTQNQKSPTPLPRKIRFLIAHENASVRKLIRGCLKTMGFALIIDLNPAGNILSTLTDEKVHVLICNGETPEMENWNLLKLLREHPENCKTKVIVASGNSDKEAILGAVQAGVDDYIIIPFSAALFEERIRALFAKMAAS